jgi:hypothetical protein
MEGALLCPHLDSLLDHVTPNAVEPSSLEPLLQLAYVGVSDGSGFEALGRVVAR